VITNLPAGYRFVFGINPTAGVLGNQAPVAVATATPKTGAPPLAVAFSSVGSFDSEGVALSYSWVFGDGGVSTAANPSHTYQAAGTYIAKLTVSDGTNTTTSGNVSITVAIPGNGHP
jgi:PKD repeat protein